MIGQPGSWREGTGLGRGARHEKKPLISCSAPYPDFAPGCPGSPAGGLALRRKAAIAEDSGGDAEARNNRIKTIGAARTCSLAELTGKEDRGFSHATWANA